MLSNGNGIKQFYKGLDAAFLHQMTYTATRMGIYRSMFHSYKTKHGHVPLEIKSSLAMFSGFLGGFIGSPADLVMVRQQLDTTLPQSKRRAYKNVFDAFKRIIIEEGPLNLWRGSNIVILRAMVLNTCLLGPFDEIKERFMGYYGDRFYIRARLIASAIASFCCCVVTLPLDNTKTKIQRMVPDKFGQMPYRGIFHCMRETVRFEGMARLWVGFGPYFMRLFPHGILILLIQDFIYEMIRK
jgi:solute carrier family 25 oxoglutarate transporter 11